MGNQTDWTPERVKALADRLGSIEALAAAISNITGNCSFWTVYRWAKGLHGPDKRNIKALDEIDENGPS